MDYSNIKEIRKGPENVRAITFRPTKWCNYNCSYCSQGHSKGEKSTEEEMVEKAKCLREVLNKLDEKYPCRYEKLLFLGGEISCFDMYKILEPLLDSEKLTNVIITSNLSGAKEAYYDVAEKLAAKIKNISFTFSFHEEYWDVDNFLSKVKDIIDYFQNKNLRIHIRTQITITDTNVEKSKEFLEKATAMDIIAIPALERQRNEEIIHTQEAIDLTHKYTDAKGKEVEIEYTDGTVERVRREEILARNNDGFVVSKDYICYDRFYSVSMNYKGEIHLRCSKCDVLDDVNEMICVKGKCDLCGNTRIRKADELNS